MYKSFRNRITQEDDATIRKLKSTYINMNYDKEKTPETPDGLFFITLQPNNYVDEIKLYDDFKFILCLFYRWRYGPKWVKKYQSYQFKFEGVIEQQAGLHNHIHFMIYELNIEKLAIFLGYIKAIFKQLYPRASFNFQRVYDVAGCCDYISSTTSIKDNFVSTRRSNIFYLNSEMFQKQINTNGTKSCSK